MSNARAVHVLAGRDRFGEHKGLGISTIDFKVSTQDGGGAALVIENTNRAKGGPARHLHVAQDELFYVLEGEYLIEVGQERLNLKPGDSLRVYAVTERGLERSLAFGPCPLPEKQDFYLL